MFATDPFLAVFGAGAPGDMSQLAGVVRAALRQGYAIVLSEPGTKKPLCTLTPAARRKADRDAQDAALLAGHRRPEAAQHACGIHHALTADDATKVTGLLDRLAGQYGEWPNIGVEPGASRLLVVDVDTPYEREGFLSTWAQHDEEAARTAALGYTVASPGVRGADGEWVHSEGGHWWFRLPDGFELPAGKGIHKDDTGWSVVWAGRQVLVPPSVRAEGPYRLINPSTDAPPFLLERLSQIVEARTERERVRAQRQPDSGDLDQVDIWSAATPWAELLEPDGWFDTGKVDTCGCSTWTAPGPHGSPKSATVHELGCAYPHWEGQRGHWPMYVWTDNPPAFLMDAPKLLNKIDYVAWRDHGGELGPAIIALGLAKRPELNGAADLAEFITAIGSPVTEPDKCVAPTAKGEGHTEDPTPRTTESSVDQFSTPSEGVDESATPIDDDDNDDDEDQGPWFDWSELDAIPAPEPIITDVMDHRTVTILAGKFGTYKTFLALDWAASVATGQDWAGHATLDSHPVVYVAAEGVGSFDRRLAAWQKGHGVGSRLPGQLTVHHGPVNVMDNEQMGALVGVIRDKGAKLVVFDTLSRCAPGLEENDAGSVSRALERVFTVRDLCDVAILIVHHTGHQGVRARGSSVLEDNADSSWVIRLDTENNEDRGPDNPRTLMHRKSKDGELIGDVPMSLHPAVGSAYLSFDPMDAPRSRADIRRAETSGVDQELATEIRQIYAEEGRMVGREVLAQMLDLPVGNKSLRRAIKIAKDTWSKTVSDQRPGGDQLNSAQP